MARKRSKATEEQEQEQKETPWFESDEFEVGVGPSADLSPAQVKQLKREREAVVEE